MKMNYLLEKILKVSSFYESIFQNIYTMPAGYILHLIKLLSEPVRASSLATTSTAWFKKEYGIENPGFHRITAMIQSSGLPVHPISLDDKGIRISALRESRSNVAYVTPSHQFPLGMIMPLSRRLELLRWANDCGGYIIEDDYDGEFRYVGKPIPSLQGLDSNERVIYMGTFSKSFLPSLRMGYIVLPTHLLKIYTELEGKFKQTVSTIQQLAFATFIHNGDWERHLNRSRTLYKRKHTLLVKSIKNDMGSRVQILGEQSGLHIVLHVHNGMNEQELIHTAQTNKSNYTHSLHMILYII